MTANTEFDMGLLVYSPNVEYLENDDVDFSRFVHACLQRFRQQDWGDTGKICKELNDRSIQTGKEAILAEYREKGKPEWTIWFLTEADRSMTTVLFPEDFAILMG